MAHSDDHTEWMESESPILMVPLTTGENWQQVIPKSTRHRTVRAAKPLRIGHPNEHVPATYFEGAVDEPLQGDETRRKTLCGANIIPENSAKHAMGSY